MKKKYEMFESNCKCKCKMSSSFRPNCIPASGEGIRQSWFIDAQHKRKLVIADLKKSNRKWREETTQNRAAWTVYVHNTKLQHQIELGNICSNELSMYSSEEKRWIHKQHRTLKQQTGIHDGDAVKKNESEIESSCLFYDLCENSEIKYRY